MSERYKSIQNASLSCLPDTWLFSLLSHLFQILSLCIATTFLPPYPFVLSILGFYLHSLTAPWHSKALLPSLTLFHGPADDNNWFENRGQWDTRIIPSSCPPLPLPHTHPARTSQRPRLDFLSSLLSACLFCFLSFIIAHWSLLSLSSFPNYFQTIIFTVISFTAHTLFYYLFFWPPLAPFIHVFWEKCETCPHRDESAFPANSGSDITDIFLHTHTHSSVKW